MNFASDNTTGAAPEIAEAVIRANAEAHAMPYGNDPLTKSLTAKFSALFEKDVTVFPVATGTAANSLGLSLMVPSYGAVFALDTAHIVEDECGAPEMFTGGARLYTLPGTDGKLLAADLAAGLKLHPVGGVHHQQPAAVSITQIGEFGHLYKPREIAALSALAKKSGLRMHMDGARFASAVAALGCAPADITWRAGIDVLSFGATKNGCFAAEAVILFDPALAPSFPFRRKRSGHLFSKMRFISAQLDAYIADGTWLKLASHANAMMRRLAKGLAANPAVGLMIDPPGNVVFVNFPTSMWRALEKAGFAFYHWGNRDWHSARLVTSFATKAEDVDRFIAVAKESAPKGRQPEMTFLPRV